MSLEDLSSSELDSISGSELEAEINQIPTSLPPIDIPDLLELCRYYREHIRVPLRKIKNTLKHWVIRRIVGDKPYKFLEEVITFLDRICPV